MQEELAARGLEVIDATCPFVEKNPPDRTKAEREGRRCLIIGTPEHPEVRAIASFCTEPVVLQSAEELQKWLDFDGTRRDLPLTMVCQTTGRKKIGIPAAKSQKKSVQISKSFDTICRATEMRQEEAIRLSRKCDAMVVVGDASSANTGRLAMICKQHCRTVTLVDHAGDLDLGLFPAQLR